jgi:hypothetical protein
MTRRSAIILALISLAALPALAGDHFLTIGGGSSASNNQVSLEKNVLYLQRFLEAAGLSSLPHEILFSDGAAGTRDLQFYDPNATVPRANELLADIFNQQHDLTTRYRAHDIPHLWGPSGRQSINRWFDTIGKTLRPGERLFIYYTGHGGRGQGNPPTNQTLAMWNEADMPVKEFTGLLDKLPPRVQVVLVMVQCFGGGFADVLYTDGDATKPLSTRNRCGFFATIPTRVAAGCTADVDEENYHEYSTYFWAALYGKTRSGEPVVPLPDYDHDGRVSLAEAHAYALIHSRTVDISMKTSDAFLRKFSKFKSTDVPGLIPSDGDFDRLLSVAAPADAAVLMELSETLQLAGPDRVRAAQTRANDLSQQRRAIEKKRQKQNDTREQIRRSIQSRVKNRWPEFANFLNPEAQRLLTDRGDAVVRFIETSPRYEEMRKLEDEVETFDKQLDDQDRIWVKCQRFIRTAESISLAANLPKLAKPDIVERYNSLVEAESGCLGTRTAADADRP